MKTRYPNAFFGYSGFVTAAADKAAPVKAPNASPVRATAVTLKKNAQGMQSRSRPQTKAA